jgi:hypothetical protein
MNIPTSIALGLSVVNSAMIISHIVYVKQRLDTLALSIDSSKKEISTKVDETLSKNFSSLDTDMKTMMNTRLNAEKDTNATNVANLETQLAEMQDQLMEIIRKSNSNMKQLLAFFEKQQITDEQNELSLRTIGDTRGTYDQQQRNRRLKRPTSGGRPRRARFQDEYDEEEEPYEDEEEFVPPPRRRPAPPTRSTPARPSSAPPSAAPAPPPSQQQQEEDEEDNGESAIERLRARRQQQRNNTSQNS